MNIVAWLISVPLAFSPMIYFAGHMFGHESQSRSVNGRASWRVSLVAVTAMWSILALAVRDLQNGVSSTVTVAGLALKLDGLSLMTAVLALCVNTLVILYSRPVLAHRIGSEKYYAMMMLTTGTIIGMVCAQDLFNLWVWFEALVIAAFLLISFYRQRPASLDASVKYLVQSAIGSLLVLIGIAIVLGETGTLSLDGIKQSVKSPALLASGALFVIGFGIKSALVPLHTWLPDAYAEAPCGTSALFSGVVTVSGLIALGRALTPLGSAAPTWGALLMGFGATNMLVGNLLALRQSDVKRLLAYSSIAHIGYILLGLGIGLHTGRTDGAQAGLFHLLTHATMKPLAFLALGAVLFSLGNSEDHDPSLKVSELKGVVSRCPLPGLAFLLALLSLAGVPPLAGFMSKWQIFVVGLINQSPIVAYLVIFAALNTLLSMGYYLPLMITLFQRNTAESARPSQALPALMQIPLIILITLILLIGIYPDLVRWLTGTAAMALMSAFDSGGLP